MKEVCRWDRHWFRVITLRKREEDDTVVAGIIDKDPGPIAIDGRWKIQALRARIATVSGRMERLISILSKRNTKRERHQTTAGIILRMTKMPNTCARLGEGDIRIRNRRCVRRFG